jgi:LAGLIDADG-like domain
MGGVVTRGELQDLQVEKENIKLISEHVPTHLRPLTDDQFGHYLAGLMDGDGSFSSYSATIAFHSNDVSLAYYIKNRIGYGKVRKVKNKNAYVLIITKREGLQILLNLINGKLRIQNKCDAVYKFLLNVYKDPLTLKDKFYLNTSSNLDNH